MDKELVSEVCLINKDKKEELTREEALLEAKEILCGLKDKMDPVLLNTIKSVFHFDLDGVPVFASAHGNGHINRTVMVTTSSGKKYILQRVSEVFDIPGLMKNVEAITSHIASKVDDPRMSLHLVKTLDGESYYHDETGSFRVFDFVDNSICLELPETPYDFYNCALAFGDFQNQLADFDAASLFEPIPDFHNTVKRYQTFHETIAKDPMKRAAGVQKEIEYALSKEEECCLLHKMRLAGSLPLRVTHNDTKINNVMLDKDTRKPLCVLDLDTVMPGLSLYDFGDAIRSGAGTAMEDEIEYEKMTIDLTMFEAFTRGFLEACKLTDEEVRCLPLGAKVMTMETGIRFLTDYLDGDHYFGIHRPDHNLDRSRTQFALVADMEAHWDEMKAIVNRLAKELYGHEVY